MRALAAFEQVTRLERASALDAVADRLESVVGPALGPQVVRDALHGVWLGHPLHPVLVQVTVGAFVGAAVADAVPGTGPAASALIGVGVASAVPAAAAGLADWTVTHPEQRRVGLVHAASNVTALVLYSGSLAARARGRTGLGRLLALGGLSAVGVGGWLGGHLAYRQASGANHGEHVPHVLGSKWRDLMPVDDLPADGEPMRRELLAMPLLVVRQGERVHVLYNRCTHLSGPLHRGTVEDGCVTCPWHGSSFRLEDGAVVHGPATSPQPVLQVRVQDGVVQVRAAGDGG